MKTQYCETGVWLEATIKSLRNDGSCDLEYLSWSDIYLIATDVGDKDGDRMKMNASSLEIARVIAGARDMSVVASGCRETRGVALNGLELCIPTSSTVEVRQVLLIKGLSSNEIRIPNLTGMSKNFALKTSDEV